MTIDSVVDNDLASATLELDRAAFVARFPPWFLIIPVQHEPRMSVRFRTVANEDFRRHAAARDRALEDGAPSLKSPRWNRRSWRAEPLMKRGDCPFADRISIGRAANVDVIVRSPVVSKIHTHVVLAAGKEPTLTDLESQNGTFINGVRLTPHKPESASNGDVVSFGQMHCELARSEVVYYAVRRRSLLSLELEAVALLETRRKGDG